MRQWTLADVEKLLFLRKGLADLADDERDELLARLNLIGLGALRSDTVQLLLCVLHDARKVEPVRFFVDLFLPWVALQTKTRPHVARIGRELERLKDFQAESTEDTAHIMNIYRNLVSDVFDPYLTLIVAAFQFQEGTFKSLEDADLGLGERNKYEYLKKRVDGLHHTDFNFLAGYDPRVRNAISHSGAQGVTYREKVVLFRNIKRGTPPIVESVEWTVEELHMRTLLLLECMQSIEICVEIFGLDCVNDVTCEFAVLATFLWNAVSPEDRAAHRRIQGAVFAGIRASDQLSDQEKLEALGRALHENCAARDMPLEAFEVAADRHRLTLTVPAVAVSDDDILLRRLTELPRYAVLAGAVFADMFATISVEERTREGTTGIAGSFTAQALEEYAEERAGLVDLMNDATWLMGGRPLECKADFEALKRRELACAQDPLPRKPR